MADDMTGGEIGRGFKRVEDALRELSGELAAMAAEFRANYVHQDVYRADEQRRLAERREVERRIDETALHTTDVGASTKRLWADLDELRRDTFSKKQLYAVVTLLTAVAIAVGALFAVFHR